MAKSDPGSIFAIVERAIVRIATRDRGAGQGVLIPGGYILTAAHCVDWDHTGGMVTGDEYTQEITTSDGKTFLVSPRAIEPCYDIALLANTHSDVEVEAWLAFEEFCESRSPVVPSFDSMPVEDPQSIFVYSHRGFWMPGKATQYGPPDHPSFLLETEQPIEGGTSGGPVIRTDGLLLGVMSTGTETGEPSPCLAPSFTGRATRITALPYWAVQDIRQS